ncbi:MAG: hypothetical protein QME68_00995, partial [Elusimicrobiota bacterium]|nr:hypothetical protein [Elusimicrobiota bacterium]
GGRATYGKLPSKARHILNYAISLGYRLSKSVLDTLPDEPNELYYFHYQRVNILLDMVALKLTNIIQEKGYNAVPIPASQVVDWSVPGGRGMVSHKIIAELAGLGWRGKNNLIVNPQYGSQVRYVTVLTDMQLESNNVQLPYGCSDCRRCIEICPAGAIREAPGKVVEFQLSLCVEKLKEFKKRKNFGHMVCGLCQKVCGGLK